MKLLLAYHDPGSIWGIKEAVEGLDGERERTGDDDARGVPDLSRFFDLCKSRSYDAIIVSHFLLQRAIKAGHSRSVADSKTPLIINEVTDGSQLNFRDPLRWPSIRAVLKRSCLSPASLNNEVSGRYHIKLLSEASVRGNKSMVRHDVPTPTLGQTALDKIFPLVGFAANPAMKPCRERELNLEDDRPIDVFFAGTTAYSGSEVARHRQLAVECCKTYRGTHREASGRTISKGPYHKIVKTAKCSVSPFGWGETCYRDFEAWLFGAILIKPSMDHVATWPDAMFNPHVSYIRCRMDFSDVHEIVDEVKANWGQYRATRRVSRQIALYAGEPAELSKRLKQILEKVL